jgi:hypothetical protein
MNRIEHSTKKDIIITFFSAFSLIVFEIFLSRFFAVILNYNYVFLVISLATLGIGLGGFMAYKSHERFNELRNPMLGLFALSMIAVVFIVYVMFFKGIIFYSFLALIPFLLGGYILAGIMQSRHDQIHIIYFSDLVGAGLGAVGSIFLMNAMNPIQTIGLLSLVMFYVYFAVSYRVSKKWMSLVTSFVFIALAYNLFNPFLNQSEFRAYQTSPFTAFSGQPDADIIYTQWNAFSRTDVYDAKDELLYITIDGSAVSPISKYSGDLKEVDYLKTTTSSLAFQYGPNENVLIIGVGGGQEVLTAQMAGFKDIEAVDINKGSFDAVHALADASGDIFNQEGVKAVVSDGRNYIRNTKNTYDLIYLSLVMKQSEQGLSLALTENFIYTQEAIKEYMSKLTNNGRLAFLLHNDMELNKMMYAAKKYYREQGIPEEDDKNYMAVVGTYQHLGHVVAGMGGSQITRPLIILQKQSFDKEIAASLLDSALQIQQIPVHIPYVHDQYETVNALFDTQHVNVEANQDDMPFFYNTSERIPVTLTLAMFVTLLVALFILRRKVLSSGQAVYFAGIAIGFMLIEVTFIQKFILPLGHPTLSFVIVLGVLLVAGGMGSFFSKRWGLFRGRYIPLLMVGLLAVLVNAMVGWYYENPLEWPQTYRVMAAVILLFPLGFFMGMPFPFGLSNMQRDQTAMSWGFNGIMTVAGSLLAAMMSLTFGFTLTIWLGAAIYAFLFVLQPILKLR